MKIKTIEWELRHTWNDWWIATNLGNYEAMVFLNSTLVKASDGSLVQDWEYEAHFENKFLGFFPTKKLAQQHVARHLQDLLNNLSDHPTAPGNLTVSELIAELQPIAQSKPDAQVSIMGWYNDHCPVFNKKQLIYVHDNAEQAIVFINIDGLISEVNTDNHEPTL